MDAIGTERKSGTLKFQVLHFEGVDGITGVLRESCSTPRYLDTCDRASKVKVICSIIR